MVSVGRRIHRKGYDQGCRRTLQNGSKCSVIETLEHCIFQCECVLECGREIKHLLFQLTGRSFGELEILSLSFRSRTSSEGKVAVWFAVRAAFEIFENKVTSTKIFLQNILKCVDWMLNMKIPVGNRNDMLRLRQLLREGIQGRKS